MKCSMLECNLVMDCNSLGEQKYSQSLQSTETGDNCQPDGPLDLNTDLISFIVDFLEESRSVSCKSCRFRAFFTLQTFDIIDIVCCLGVTPSMESKKLDSMRERQGSTPQTAAPSVSAPTLSKLLADTPTVTSSSVSSISSHGGALTKVFCRYQSGLQRVV